MLETRRNARRFGPELVKDGVRFSLWAPTQTQLSVVLDQRDVYAMTPIGDGWFEFVSATAKPGTLYQFRLGDGMDVPDPASRHQPTDVHGPSEVIDPQSYSWSDDRWRGRPWHEAVLYELHIGTFTEAGTFRAAIERLDWLASLGVTAIEIMPVADFPGNRNWGYDGVLLFAPDGSYGRPDDLKALVDAAHARGIMVFLDVVYNHFGPDGNYLPTYSPVFTDRHKTPWGNAVNYEAVGSGAMREFVIANAEYWIEEFHLDGLRLDAVHAMLDDSDPHVLEEIAARVRAAEPGRMLHLMIENEENRASLLSRNERGEPVAYTAQWNDDLHHVLHCAASGESSGYYADYAGDTERLGRALAEGFAFQGEVMPFRGRARGEPSRGLPPTAFVSFIQNHDHVGNRAFGDRLTAFSPEAAVRAVAAVYLLLPQIPMLFMGEEFAAPEPFLFFCDFEPELAKAVSEGRRAEFKKFPEFADPQKRDHIPDPSAEESFRASKLDWRKCEEPALAAFAEHYRALLTIRHRDIVPRLAGAKAGRFEILGDGAVSVRWKMGDGTQLQLIANLADRPSKLVTAPAGRKLWSQGATEASMEPPSMQPWGVLWTLNERGAA